MQEEHLVLVSHTMYRTKTIIPAMRNLSLKPRLIADSAGKLDRRAVCIERCTYGSEGGSR
jgi:hypothetical protein